MRCADHESSVWHSYTYTYTHTHALCTHIYMCTYIIIGTEEEMHTLESEEVKKNAAETGMSTENTKGNLFLMYMYNNQSILCPRSLQVCVLHRCKGYSEEAGQGEGKQMSRSLQACSSESHHKGAREENEERYIYM